MDRLFVSSHISPPDRIHSCLQRRPLSDIQVRLCALSLPGLLRLPVLDRLARDSEPFNARRHTAVTCRLQNHFSDLFFSTSVVQCSLDVGSELCTSILAT
jgi:hypothetical protein